MAVTSQMIAAACWMAHGNTWCLLDALGYSLVPSARIIGGAWIFAGNWWCLDVCWYFLVVTGCLPEIVGGVWMFVLVPVGDEQLGSWLHT